jgi:hypothetical protein
MTCPCMLAGQSGGYKATRRNKRMLRAYKAGRAGFTMKASLKAKGMIPRTSGKYRGKYVLGPKYSGTGRNRVLTRRVR